MTKKRRRFAEPEKGGVAEWSIASVLKTFGACFLILATCRNPFDESGLATMEKDALLVLFDRKRYTTWYQWALPIFTGSIVMMTAAHPFIPPTDLAIWRCTRELRGAA